MSQQSVPADVIAILRWGSPGGEGERDPFPSACSQILPSKRRCPAARVGLHNRHCAAHSGSCGVRAPHVDMAAVTALLEAWAESGVPPVVAAQSAGSPADPQPPSAAVALRMASQGDMSGIAATASAQSAALLSRATSAERAVATLQQAEQRRMQAIYDQGVADRQALATKHRRWLALSATATGRKVLLAEIGVAHVEPLPPQPRSLPLDRWRAQRADTEAGRRFLASVGIPPTGALTATQRERAANLVLAAGFWPEGA